MPSRVSEILRKFRSMENPKNRSGMARYGINTDAAYGISMPVIRSMARDIGRNHRLAQGRMRMGG